MTHLAQETGVSVAVVSRLLRGDSTLRISEARRKQILEAKERLGGVRVRRSLKKRKLTNTIVVPVNRMFPPAVLQRILLGSEFIRHFEKTLNEHGFRLHLSLFDPHQPKSAYEPLVPSSSYDGLLLLSGICNHELAELLRRHRFPHVSNDYWAEQYQINTVHVHSAGGLRQVVTHLHRLGHQRIGFVGPRDSYRYPLAVAAMVSMGLVLDESFNCWVDPIDSLDPQEHWRLNAHRAMAGWLKTRPPVTALICANDYLAMGAVDAMKEHKLTPGRDLSLVGYDNLEQRGSLCGPAAEPMLTTIDNPQDLVGRRAAELLLNQILHGQTQIVHEQIPATLIVRQSSGPC